MRRRFEGAACAEGAERSSISAGLMMGCFSIYFCIPCCDYENASKEDLIILSYSDLKIGARPP